MMKKVLSIALCLLLVFAMAACGGDASSASEPNAAAPSTSTPGADASTGDPADGDQPTYKFAYVSKSLSNELFVLMGDGMRRAIEAINADAGYEKITFEEHTTANESDVEQMLTLVDTLLATDIDALIITPASSNSFADVVRRCNDAGIPFINLDTKVDATELADVGANYDVFVGTDNFQMGRDLFQSAVDAFDGVCKYIVLGGFEGASTHIDMMTGFEEQMALAPDTMVQLDYQAADWNRNKAFEVASALLTAHPDVEAFLCFNDQMASGAMQAMETIGLVPGEDIKLFGSSFVGDAYQNVWDGRLTASVSRVPFETGKIAVEQAIRLLEGQELEHPVLNGNLIEIPGKAVTKDDIELVDGVFYDLEGTPLTEW